MSEMNLGVMSCAQHKNKADPISEIAQGLTKFVLLLFIISVSFHSLNAQSRQLEVSSPIDKTEREKAAIVRAELVIVGTIESVGKAPPYKSGRVKAYQQVTYKVIELLKGQLAKDDRAHFTVSHLVVVGSRNANPLPGTNELSPTIFHVGNSLIVAIYRGRENEEIWMDIDEDYGTFLATDKNIIEVKSLIEKYSVH